MPSIVVIIIVFCLYMGLMFAIALKTESGNHRLSQWSQHPVIHACALGIYCTTWTFYGSVGNAATSGLTFLTFYLGPTMVIFLWPLILRKMVRIKHKYRITSIADFISARYSKSQTLASLVTMFALVGVIPYVALQLRATFSTFKILAMHSYQGDIFVYEQYMAWLIMGLMIIFTILFGARRLDPTETHKGMIVSIAFQSLVQLGALLAVGIFVTYFVFHGFEDMFSRLAVSRFSDMIFVGSQDQSHYLVWATYLILSMSALMFLPRQFHVAVVENSREENIKTILWVFPLYMFLISVFIVPIAMGGLLSGLPVQQADSFVLRLPLLYNQFWLAVVVFLGGISAATSMIMISSMTIATMVTNHILLPVLNLSRRLDFLKRHLLKFRWLFIALFIMAGYLFDAFLKESYMLVNIGLISFAAVLQFAPVILGALYWREANRRGAFMGLIGGFVVWFYTLLFPAMIKSGWGAPEILINGPWDLAWLRPEDLFGIALADNMVHAVFWSLLVNGGLFIFGSLSRENSEMEQRGADNFLEVLSAQPRMRVGDTSSDPETIDLSKKVRAIRPLLKKYFDAPAVERMIQDGLQKNSLNERERISVVELAEFQNEMEKILAGSLGAAEAHQVMTAAALFSETEARELSRAYGDILSDFKLAPEELINKVDYYKERELLLSQHAAELEEKVTALDHEVNVRKAAEKALGDSEYKYRILIENLPQRIFRKNVDGIYNYCNDIYAHDLGVSRYEVPGKTDYDFFPVHLAEKYREDDMRVISRGDTIDFEEKYAIDGQEIWVHTVKSPIRDEHDQVVGLLGIFWDITERKKFQDRLYGINEELEARVKERTQELIEANRELHNKILELEKTKSELEEAYLHLQETKDQLLQVEKLASIGQLAAGVAHEINNPVGFIKSNLTIFSRYWDHLVKYMGAVREHTVSKADAEPSSDAWIKKLEKDLNIDHIKQDLPFLIKESQEGTDRIQKIVSDLKNFARKEQEADYEEVDFNRIVKSALTIVGNEIKPKCRVKKHLARLPRIKCSRQKICQVIVNLLMNASQAMEEKGVIRLNTYARDGYVYLEVEDNGAGMSPQVIKRIFDPFFTTKEAGQGTGLGLSISYDVIKKHKGTMNVESEIGKGTKFIIRLPI
jgi:PAS domain S-box-containing protein